MVAERYVATVAGGAFVSSGSPENILVSAVPLVMRRYTVFVRLHEHLVYSIQEELCGWIHCRTESPGFDSVISRVENTLAEYNRSAPHDEQRCRYHRPQPDRDLPAAQHP